MAGIIVYLLPKSNGWSWSLTKKPDFFNDDFLGRQVFIMVRLLKYYLTSHFLHIWLFN